MLRLCFIKTYIEPAGPEISLRLLFGGLKKLGMRIWVVNLDLDKNRWSCSEYGRARPLVSAPLRARWDPSYASRLAGEISSLVRALKIQAIDGLYNKKSIPLFIRLIDRNPGIPFFLRFYTHVFADRYRLTRIASRADRGSFRNLLERADTCVAISRYIARDVCGDAVVARAKCRVIPDAVEKPAREAGKLPRQRHSYILYLGRLEQSKGLDMLLMAFQALAAEFPEARLRIVGRGRLRGHLVRLAGMLGLGRQVKFEDWADYRHVPGLIRGAEFVVLPSRVEPFGRPLAEAMACGRPAVATRVGGMPEIIRHGRNGLLSDPDPRSLGAAMRRLYIDGPLRSRLAASGRVEAQKYFIETIARRHKELYEKRIARHRL